MKNRVIAITLMLMMVITGFNILPGKTILAKNEGKGKPKIEKIKLKIKDVDYTKIAKVKNPPLKPLTKKEREKVVKAALKVIRHKPHINYGEDWAPGGLHNSWRSLVCTTYVQKVFKLSGIKQLQRFTENNPRYYRVSEFWNDLLTENKRFKRKTPMIIFNKGKTSTRSMLKMGNAGDLFIICKKDSHGRPVEHIGFCDGNGGVYHCTWGKYKIKKKYKKQDGVYHHNGAEFASGNNTSKNGAIKAIVRLSLGTLSFNKDFVNVKDLSPNAKWKKYSYKFNIRCKGVINRNFSIKWNEKLRIHNLPMNKKYKVTEILTKEQKKYFKQPKPYLLTSSNTHQDILFRVKQESKKSKLWVRKLIEEGVNLPLNIFKFKLYEYDKKNKKIVKLISEKTTDKNGFCKWDFLPVDRYYYVEEQLTDEIKDRVDTNSLVKQYILLKADPNFEVVRFEAINYAKAEYGKLKLTKHGSNLVGVREEQVNGIKVKKQVINEIGFAGASFEIRAGEDISFKDTIGTDFEKQFNPEKKRTDETAIPKGTLLRTVTTDSLGLIDDETKYPAKKDTGTEYTVKEIKTKPNYEINPREAKVKVRRISELEAEFFKKHYIKPKTHTLPTKHKGVDYSELYGKEDRSVYYDSEEDGINDGGDVPSKDGKYELHKADKAINSRQGASRNDLQGYTGAESEPETPEYEYIKHEPQNTKTIPFKDPNEGKTEATAEDFEEYKKSQVRFTEDSILGSNKFKKLAVDIDKQMEANGSISSPIDSVIFGVVAEEDIKAANGNKINKGDIVSILDKQKISQYKAHFTNKNLLIPAKYSIKELKTDKGYILPKDKINAEYEQNNTKKIINKVNPNAPQTGRTLWNLKWLIAIICMLIITTIKVVEFRRRNKKYKTTK